MMKETAKPKVDREYVVVLSVVIFLVAMTVTNFIYVVVTLSGQSPEQVAIDGTLHSNALIFSFSLVMMLVCIYALVGFFRPSHLHSRY